MAQVVMSTISHLNAQPMYHNFIKTSVVSAMNSVSACCFIGFSIFLNINVSFRLTDMDSLG